MVTVPRWSTSLDPTFIQLRPTLAAVSLKQPPHSWPNMGVPVISPDSRTLGVPPAPVAKAQGVMHVAVLVLLVPPSIICIPRIVRCGDPSRSGEVPCVFQMVKGDAGRE